MTSEYVLDKGETSKHKRLTSGPHFSSSSSFRSPLIDETQFISVHLNDFEKSVPQRFIADFSVKAKNNEKKASMRILAGLLLLATTVFVFLETLPSKKEKTVLYDSIDLKNLKCIPREYPEGIVCVCNATYCDSMEPAPTEIGAGQALVFTSSKSGKRWEQSIIKMELSVEQQEPNLTSTANNSDAASNKKVVSAKVTVDLSTRLQEIIGFGGAITDSASRNILSLSKEAQERLMRSYYGPQGSDYTLGRTPMAATDFSDRVYSYCDHEGDFALENFSLQHEDLEQKIPLIKKATELSEGKVRFFASPWSAPAWMKKSGKMVGGGPLKGEVNGPYYKTWAKYFVRYFEEYTKQGVNFWGLTLENEPVVGGNLNMLYPGMYLSPEMHVAFVRELWGPALRNNSVTQHLKLMIFDDNRAELERYAKKILKEKNVSKYVDGLAVHWYTHNASPSLLDRTHHAFPSKFLLSTEACSAYSADLGPLWGKRGPHLGHWTFGEYYAQNIIDNLNHWVTGWTDWNIALNETGGPSYVPSVGTDSPIIVNASADEFYKQPMYYALAHFSKFIRPGHVRIGINIKDPLRSHEIHPEFQSFNNESFANLEFESAKPKNLESEFAKSLLFGTATLDPASPSGRVTVVLLNTREVDYKIFLKIKHSAESDTGPANSVATHRTLALNIERRSITTLLLDTKIPQKSLSRN